MTVAPNTKDLYFFAAEITYNAHRFLEAIKFCEEGLKHMKENYWCTIVGSESPFPYLILSGSHHQLGNKILGLGYAALARSKVVNSDTDNLYNTIIQDLNRG